MVKKKTNGSKPSGSAPESSSPGDGGNQSSQNGGESLPATREASLPAQQQELADMYKDDDVGAQDIMIPRILLMQGQSKMVADERAKAGQIVGSLEGELLADRGATIEFIPFHRFKSFRLFKAAHGGGRPLFIKEVPYDKDTIEWEEKRTREVTIDGETLQVFITWNYYVLLKSDIEGLPRMLSFSSTSYKVGRTLTTLTVEAKKMGLALPFKTYILGTEAVSNDKGNWYLFTVAKGEKTEKDALRHVHDWARMAKAGQVKVAEDEEFSGPEPESSEPIEAGGVNDQKF